MNNEEAIRYLRKLAMKEPFMGKNADYSRGVNDGRLSGAVFALEAVGIISIEEGNEFIMPSRRLALRESLMESHHDS